MNLKDILDDILSLVTQLSLTIRKARKPLTLVVGVCQTYNRIRT